MVAMNALNPDSTDCRRAARRNRRDPGGRPHASSGPTVQSIICATSEKVRSTVSPTRAVMPTPSNSEEARMTDTVLARLAALKTLPIPALKQQWRDLFETEPPPYNRRFLENRLAYRIQELAYGGLKPETVKRLQGARRGARRRRSGAAPPARQGPADRRHAAHPRMAGRRALRHGARRRTSSTRAGPTNRSRPSPAPSPARAGTAWCSSASRTGGHRA